METKVEYELSKRDNVRKFNHKVINNNTDLNSIFGEKAKMNSSTPQIFDSPFSIQSEGNHARNSMEFQEKAI